MVDTRRYTSYTANGSPRYNIEIGHTGLSKFRHIVHADEDIVEQKAEAQIAKWDAKWEKQEAASIKAQSKEQRKALAEERSREAAETIAGMRSILAATLDVDDTVDWERLKDKIPFSIPPPKKPILQPAPIKSVQAAFPRQPSLKDPKHEVRKSILLSLFSSLRLAKEKESERVFQADMTRWNEEMASITRTYEMECEAYTATVADWQDKVPKAKSQHRSALARHEGKRKSHLEQQDKHNRQVDKAKELYAAGGAEMIMTYCDLVLRNSSYPEWMPRDWTTQYNEGTKVLVMDYVLPALSDLPKLKEVRYVQSSDKLTEVAFSERELNALFDDCIYQIMLRTLHELFTSDAIDAIQSVALNGLVTYIDKASGHEVTACIASVQASKEEFLKINLGAVEPRACFKTLKGVASSKLYGMAPVAPLVRMDKTDARFVEGRAVAEGLEESANLAAMPWEDFEHLVRELFEKEFAASGL
jgi:restriction system protein